MASNYRNSPNTVCRNVSISVEDYDLFSRLYPHLFTKYIQRCVKLAIMDKSFFNEVFFRFNQESNWDVCARPELVDELYEDSLE